MPEKLYISWEDFHQHTKALAAKIKASGEYDKIIAVSRGGLVPAGIISYELNIRNTQAINISSYDGDKQRDSSAIEVECADFKSDKKTLIIDDLSDTGQTFCLLRKMFPLATLASVYTKPQGSKYVDIYAEDIPDAWIVFPWDI